MNSIWQCRILPSTSNETENGEDLSSMDLYVERQYLHFFEILKEFCSQTDFTKHTYVNPEADIDRTLHNPSLVVLYHTCLQLVSKPNVHRLYEFHAQSIMMWRHPVWVGELSLQRAHRTVKHSLLRDNNENEHIHIMQTIRFSDWKAPLNSCYRKVEGNWTIDQSTPSVLLTEVTGTSSLSVEERQANYPRIQALLQPDQSIHRELILQQCHMNKPSSFKNHRVRFIPKQNLKFILPEITSSRRSDVRHYVLPHINNSLLFSTSMRYQCVCDALRG